MLHVRRLTSTRILLIASLVAVTQALSTAPLRAQTIVVSGNPAVLTVHTAMAGFELDPVGDATTTYAVTSTVANQKIIARLDAPLPSGVALRIQLVAPPGATSRGPVSLTTLDQEVVGAIPTPGTYTGLTIVYTLVATVRSGFLPASARAVTFAVVAGP
jgi:hypothetical protein